ncbi:hypothetical protein UA08_09124 [Talaromyces atroroseus]|uniref:Uncharacterized protein n=1 Tax=Talaromyces atroroseus TaxID=1441469 RepID=A0A1Q5Q720_TALAT|nr:hypothetical protein UA08_09124 [Talaromyces atroroseus]OKL55645.1 hypothetical protein UA08_09124 [Talaromyces atroroseus]
MDREYLDFLIQWEKQDDWSFFDLTGCSGDLILFMYELAELAKQREIANSMKWLTFDVTPVLEIEKELVSWNNQAGSVADEDIAGLSEVEAEKLFHKAQDRHHCAEAWRCALLLYIRRVFKSVQQRPVIAQLVRRIIDHTTCCRRAFQTQKQLLLPVFLAGSETSDQDMRDYVKEYCDYWGKKSRYRMFNTVPLVLDQVWKSGQWWAPVIDQMSTVHGATQLLLG